MAQIIRFPIVLAPSRRRRLARQEGVGPAAFDTMLRHQDRLVAAAGGPPLGPQDRLFVAACLDGRIKPRDIAGPGRSAEIARRIARDLNRQGARERNEPWSG